MFTLEDWKKIWDTKLHLIYIAGLVLLTVIAIIVGQLIKPGPSYYQSAQIVKNQDVQQQKTQEPKQESKQEPPVLPGFNVLKKGDDIKIYDLAKKPVTSLTGNLYKSGIMLSMPEMHIRADEERSAVVTVIAPQAKKYRKIKFTLAQKTIENQSLDDYLDTKIEIYCDKKRVFAKTATRDNLITRDIPVEIDIAGASEIDVVVKNATRDRDGLGDWQFFDFILGDLQFIEEVPSDVPAKPATA